MAGSLAFRELSEQRGDASSASLSLACRSDDGALRALLRRSVIPGAVRIAFTREPKYFEGEGLTGGHDATVAARLNGRLVGMAHCATHALFRNGREERVGYLGELRLLPGTPAAPRLLRDGYALLAKAMRGHSVVCFFTSIGTENDRARRVLEHGTRFGLPAYRPLATLVTLVAPVHHARARAGSPDAASEADAAELAEFLQERAKGAQLSLAWNVTQWSALARHRITAQSFAVVRRGGRITAAAAVWDQRSFRQTVVDSYTGPLRPARLLLNAARALGRLPPLPAAGSVLALGAVLGASVAEVSSWSVLWRALESRAASMGLSWLALSRDARDSELPILRRLLRAREYHTTLYEVALDTPSGTRDDWDARVFRPEVALL